jgi:hypothetical protein
MGEAGSDMGLCLFPSESHPKTSVGRRSAGTEGNVSLAQALSHGQLKVQVQSIIILYVYSYISSHEIFSGQGRVSHTFNFGKLSSSYRSLLAV